MTGSNDTKTKTPPTSNDLVDDLVRQMCGVEPDVMASLAHGDAEVQLRRWPGSGSSTDPLDGLDVFVRRTVGACLAMRDHDGAVALVTERQARDAGWPTARLANMSLVLARGLAITEPAGVLPLLVEADEDADGSDCVLVRADDHLPTLDELLAALRRGQQTGPLKDRARVIASGPAVPRALVSLAAQLGDWLGVDAAAVELPSDRLGMVLTSGDARATGVVAWIVTAALATASAMAEERVTGRAGQDRSRCPPGGPARGDRRQPGAPPRRRHPPRYRRHGALSGRPRRLWRRARRGRSADRADTWPVGRRGRGGDGRFARAQGSRVARLCPCRQARRQGRGATALRRVHGAVRLVGGVIPRDVERGPEGVLVGDFALAPVRVTPTRSTILASGPSRDGTWSNQRQVRVLPATLCLMPRSCGVAPA